MSENILMLICGLACIGDERDQAFVGFANPDEMPYDFSTRLLSMGKQGYVPAVQNTQSPGGNYVPY